MIEKVLDMVDNQYKSFTTEMEKAKTRIDVNLDHIPKLRRLFKE